MREQQSKCHRSDTQLFWKCRDVGLSRVKPRCSFRGVDMKFMTYNIQYTKGRDLVFDTARIAREVADADIIALQEIERFAPRSGERDQVADLAELLPYHHYVFGPAIDVDGSFTDESGKLHRRRRQFGNMLLSRFPILWSKNHMLPHDAPLVGAGPQRAMLEGCIDVNGKLVRVVSVHFDHLDPQTRLPMVRYAIDKLMVEHASDGGVWTGVVDDPAWSVFGPSPSTRAVILMGDLNFRPATEEYTLFVGNLNQQHGRITRRNGFVDAYVAAGHAEEAGDTHDNGGRIDHIMVWAPMRAGIRSVSIDNQALGSDHYPVWMEFDENLLPAPDDF